MEIEGNALLEAQVRQVMDDSLAGRCTDAVAALTRLGRVHGVEEGAMINLFVSLSNGTEIAQPQKGEKL